MKNGEAHSIYISDQEWKDYAALVKAKTGEKVGPHIVELIRQDREALSGKPVIASPEGVERLRNKSIQLEKELEVIISKMKPLLSRVIVQGISLNRRLPNNGSLFSSKMP